MRRSSAPFNGDLMVSLCFSTDRIVVVTARIFLYSSSLQAVPLRSRLSDREERVWSCSALV